MDIGCYSVGFINGRKINCNLLETGQFVQICNFNPIKLYFYLFKTNHISYTMLRNKIWRKTWLYSTIIIYFKVPVINYLICKTNFKCSLFAHE